MSYHFVGVLLFVALIGLLMPSSAFAQTWETEETAPKITEEAQTEPQEEEPYGGWDIPEEAEKTPNIPLMVFAQAGGIFVSYVALGATALTLFLYAWGSNNDTIFALGFVPIIAIPIAWPLVTNTIGHLMDGGSHLGWSFAGAALGLAGVFGFGILSDYFDQQQFDDTSTAFSQPAAVTFWILAAASPFVGTIGGYHFGRSRAAASSQSAENLQITEGRIGLSPLMGPERGVGASLNLSFSF